ncbi:MAG: heavy-metal-associated domain-containing protein [Myxococcales bacterium]|nr:heavy-metal-associated domain-containing protein [Myxococcales bacterium]
MFLAALPACGRGAPGSQQTAAVHLASTTLHVEGMTCASCEVTVRTVAGKVDGVHSVDVDHATGVATVQYDPARIGPVAVASAITAMGYPTQVAVETSKPAASTSVAGFDPAMAAMCQAGCAAVEDYEAADVVSQPGARAGDLTQCPVSGVVFRLTDEHPSFVSDGQTWFTCCGMCMKKLEATPDRFIQG